MKIEEAIKQKVFLSEYHKLHVNLFYTQSLIELRLSKVLKPHQLSPQQFNILRILKGRFPKPASIRELTDLMIDKASNASRIVDKLLSKKLVNKSACKKDSRKMEVVITEAGLNNLETASREIEKFVNETYGVLTVEEAQSLNAMLDRIKE